MFTAFILIPLGKLLTGFFAVLCSGISLGEFGVKRLIRPRSGPMIDSGFQDVAGLAKRLLLNSSFASVRALHVRLLNEHLELYGEVESFYIKQIAQETIRSATRNFEVINAIEVKEEN